MRTTEITDGGEQSKWRQVRIPFSEETIKLIGQNYNLEHQPSDEKIVNHETDLLIISPKFAGRPTKTYLLRP